MCLGGGASVPAAPAPPPPPPPPPQLPNAQVQGAGANAASRARSAAGPLAMLFNPGGAQGLTTPPDTTHTKTALGA